MPYDDESAETSISTLGSYSVRPGGVVSACQKLAAVETPRSACFRRRSLSFLIEMGQELFEMVCHPQEAPHSSDIAWLFHGPDSAYIVRVRAVP